MLIPFSSCMLLLKDYNIKVTGILHIGAHLCEEKEDYNNSGIPDSNIYWVDGNEELVRVQKERGIPNVFYSLIDNTEREVEFNITNNKASSSLLELGTHADHYRDIWFVEQRRQTTTTLKNFINKNSIDITKLNFWNFDIQGTELRALHSAAEYIQFADAIYCEVNCEYVYKDCALIEDIDAFLLEKGFVRMETRIAPSYGWGDALYVRRKK